MSVTGRRSNCSSGVKVDFYWAGVDSADEAEHIKAAVAALFEAVRNAGTRRWNPWNRQAILAEFRAILARAAEGDLVPVDEVKSVSDGTWPLYEIRWHDIPVIDVIDGVEHFDEIEVRLLHAEPLELSMCAVGLHAHQKATTGDVHAMQDQEIEVARLRYLTGYSTRWGVRDRSR